MENVSVDDEYMTAEFQELSDEDEGTLMMSCWNSKTNPVEESNRSNHNNNSGGFECNICLDSVQDPVVTFCGHLYCWPCLYKWIHCETVSPSKPDHQQPQCPVCKADVSEKTLVPLYGRDPCSKSSDHKATNSGSDIPQRPQTPRCTLSVQAPVRGRSSNLHPYQGRYMAPPVLSLGGAGNNNIVSLSQPMVGMFGEVMYGRIFGSTPDTSLYTYPNSYNVASRTMSQRMRRRVMAVDRSLSRICFFLFCCMVLCLLLF